VSSGRELQTTHDFGGVEIDHHPVAVFHGDVGRARIARRIRDLAHFFGVDEDLEASVTSECGHWFHRAVASAYAIASSAFLPQVANAVRSAVSSKCSSGSIGT